MNESDDYKRGWYDGYQAGQKDNARPPVVYPTIPAPVMNSRCGTCGIDFGNKTWGYVCNHPNCPSKITAQVSYSIGGAGSGPIGGAGNPFPPGANGPIGNINGN